MEFKELWFQNVDQIRLAVQHVSCEHGDELSLSVKDREFLSS
jgi:hypothetical protein